MQNVARAKDQGHKEGNLTDEEAKSERPKQKINYNPKGHKGSAGPNFVNTLAM